MIHEQSTQANIIQFCAQKAIPITYTDESRHEYEMACPFCESEMRVNYNTGKCHCRCFTKDWEAIKWSVVNYHNKGRKQYAKWQVKGWLCNLEIRWVYAANEYHTSCPKCSGGPLDNLTLLVSGNINLCECSRCGGKTTFTNFIKFYQMKRALQELRIDYTVSNTQKFVLKCPWCKCNTIFLSNDAGKTYCRSCRHPNTFECLSQKIKEHIGRYQHNTSDECSPASYVSKTQAESYLNSWENVPKSSFITKEMLALCTEKIMSQSYFEKMFMNEMPYPDISRMERHYGKPMEGCVLRHPVDGNVTGRFAKGGLITGREFVKIKPDHFLVQTDFSGVETRIINQMARKSGRSFMSKVEQSREALKQFADGMRHTSEKMRVVCDDLAKSKKYFQLMRDNFLKGEWIMYGDGENQTIKLGSPDAFNPNELADMVTREYPFMYTKGMKPEQKPRVPVKNDLKHLTEKQNLKRKNRSASDIYKWAEKQAEKPQEVDVTQYHNDCVCVFIHESLIHKAHRLGIQMPKEYPFKQASCGNWYCQFEEVKGNVHKLKKFFKDVRAAAWKTKRKVNVKCTFEEI